MLQNINKLFTWSRFPRIPQLPHVVLNLRNIFSYRHRPTRELLSLIYSCGIYSIPKSHLYIWHIFIHCLKTNKNQLNFWQTFPHRPPHPISHAHKGLCAYLLQIQTQKIMSKFSFDIRQMQYGIPKSSEPAYRMWQLSQISQLSAASILRLYQLQPASLVMHQASLSGVSDQANFADGNNHLINPCLSKS